MQQPGQRSLDGRWYWNGAAWVPVAAPDPTGWQRGHAGFWLRLAAAFIDGLVLIPVYVLASVISNVIAAVAPNSAVRIAGSFLFWPLYLLGGWLYYALLESSRSQATLGKMALGIVVTDAAGNRLSFGRATARYFAKFLSVVTCYIGYLMAAFTQRKQALHDLVAGTLVLRKEPGPVTAGSGAGATAVIAVIGSFVAVLMLTSLVVIVILLSMGNQIKNVFNNVVVALGGG